MRVAGKAFAVLVWIIAGIWAIGMIASIATSQIAAAVVGGLLTAAFILLGARLWRRVHRKKPHTSAVRNHPGLRDHTVESTRIRAEPPPGLSSARVSPTRPALVRPDDSSLTAHGPSAERTRPAAPTRAGAVAKFRRGGSARDGITRVGLTRGRGVPASDVAFSVIDLETTGLRAASSRVVEIGLVKIRGDGTVIDEFATLIAGSPVGESTSVHGISDDDLDGAPTWARVWPEVEQLICGTVLVAHNLDFEQAFLEAEVRRAGCRIPPILGLCTLSEARRQLDGRAFSLKSLHKTVSGSWRSDDHTALGDARATADLLLWLLRSGPTTLALSDSPRGTPILNPTPSTAVRFRSAGWGTRSVSALVSAFPDSPRDRPLDPSTLMAYEQELDLALEDGRLTGTEAERLAAIGRRLGATRNQLRQIHRRALDRAQGTSTDAPLTVAHKIELARRLGLDNLVEQLQQTMPEPQDAPWTASLLRSWRIACVGDSQPLNDVRNRAMAFGVRIAKNVTKTVRFTVTDQPDSQATALRSSLRFGIPVISAAEAARRLDAAIEAAVREHEELERQRRQYEEDHRRRVQEADAYWRHSWRRIELPTDPGPSVVDSLRI